MSIPAMGRMSFNCSLRCVRKMSRSYRRKGFSPGQNGLSERINTKRKTPKKAICDRMRMVFRVEAFFITALEADLF
jgi:hypothetical protein